MRKTAIRKISDKQQRLMNYRALMKPIVFEAQGKKCKRCGTSVPDFRGWQLVHVKPLSLGGKDELSNYEVDCARCHFTDPELHNLVEVDSKPMWSRREVEDANNIKS